MIVCDVLKPLYDKDASAFDINIVESELVFDVGPYEVFSIQAEPNTTWGTAILALKRSNDAKVARDLETGPRTLTVGGEMTEGMDCSAFKYLHIATSTVEGTAQRSVRITVIGKAS